MKKIITSIFLLLAIEISHQAHLDEITLDLNQDESTFNSEFNELNLKDFFYLNIGGQIINVNKLLDQAYMNDNCFLGLLQKDNEIKSLFKIHQFRTTVKVPKFVEIDYQTNGQYRKIINKLEDLAEIKLKDIDFYPSEFNLIEDFVVNPEIQEYEFAKSGNKLYQSFKDNMEKSFSHKNVRDNFDAKKLMSWIGIDINYISENQDMKKLKNQFEQNLSKISQKFRKLTDDGVTPKFGPTLKKSKKRFDKVTKDKKPLKINQVQDQGSKPAVNEDAQKRIDQLKKVKKMKMKEDAKKKEAEKQKKDQELQKKKEDALKKQKEEELKQKQLEKEAANTSPVDGESQDKKSDFSDQKGESEQPDHPNSQNPEKDSAREQEQEPDKDQNNKEKSYHVQEPDNSQQTSKQENEKADKSQEEGLQKEEEKSLQNKDDQGEASQEEADSTKEPVKSNQTPISDQPISTEKQDGDVKEEPKSESQQANDDKKQENQDKSSELSDKEGSVEDSKNKAQVDGPFKKDHDEVDVKIVNSPNAEQSSKSLDKPSVDKGTLQDLQNDLNSPKKKDSSEAQDNKPKSQNKALLSDKEKEQIDVSEEEGKSTDESTLKKDAEEEGKSSDKSPVKKDAEEKGKSTDESPVNKDAEEEGKSTDESPVNKDVSTQTPKEEGGDENAKTQLPAEQTEDKSKSPSLNDDESQQSDGMNVIGNPTESTELNKDGNTDTKKPQPDQNDQTQNEALENPLKQKPSSEEQNPQNNNQAAKEKSPENQNKDSEDSLPSQNEGDNSTSIDVNKPLQKGQDDSQGNPDQKTDADKIDQLEKNQQGQQNPASNDQDQIGKAQLSQNNLQNQPQDEKDQGRDEVEKEKNQANQLKSDENQSNTNPLESDPNPVDGKTGENSAKEGEGEPDHNSLDTLGKNTQPGLKIADHDKNTAEDDLGDQNPADDQNLQKPQEDKQDGEKESIDGKSLSTGQKEDDSISGKPKIPDGQNADEKQTPRDQKSQNGEDTLKADQNNDLKQPLPIDQNNLDKLDQKTLEQDNKDQAKRDGQDLGDQEKADKDEDDLGQNEQKNDSQEKAEKEKADQEKAEKEKAVKQKADEDSEEKPDQEKAEKEKAAKLKAAEDAQEKEAKDKAEKEAQDKAEQDAKQKVEKEAKAEAEKKAKDKAEKEAKDKAEKEAKAKAEKEARDKAEQDARDKAEQDAREKAEKEAKDKAEKEAKAKAEKEAKDKAEKEAKAKAEKEAREKAQQEAKEKAEKDAREKAQKEAKAKAEKEAKEKAEKEAKAKAEKEAKEKAEKEAKAKAEKEAKEKAEKEAKAKAEKEAKEKSEKEAKEKAEKEAQAKAEKDSKEKAQKEAKEKAEKEAKAKAEKEAKEKSEKEAKEKEAKEKADIESKETKALSYEQIKQEELHEKKLQMINQMNMDNFKPVVIVFETSLLEDSLNKIFADKSDKKKTKLLAMNHYVIKILKEANSFLRKYVMVKQGSRAQDLFGIGNFTKCNKGSRMFNRNGRKLYGSLNQLDADTVVLVDVISDEQSQVIAAAGYCQKTKTNFSSIGRIVINIANIDVNPTYFVNYSQMMTVVHEIFHIFAFSKVNLKSSLFDKIDSQNVLKLVKNLDEPLLDGGDHWNNLYVPNDLMVPTERYDAILTIFSLNVIDEISPDMKTSKKYLQNNFNQETILDVKNMNFKCSDKIPFHFKHQICSRQEYNQTGCDPSFIYKTICTDMAVGKQTECFERTVINSSICTDSTLQQNLMESAEKKNPRGRGKKSSGQSLEVFSPESRCFEFSIANKQNALCLKFNMKQEGIEILFDNGKLPVICPINQKKPKENEEPEREQVEFTYKYKKFVVQCPNYYIFQSTFKKTDCPDFCHGNGFCTNGSCVCFDGYDQYSNCKKEIPLYESQNFFTKYFSFEAN